MYYLGNSIQDIKPFCRPLFYYHRSVVKCTSSLLQQQSRYETGLPAITEIAPPPNLTGWIRPCSQMTNKIYLHSCSHKGVRCFFCPVELLWHLKPRSSIVL